MMKFLKVIWTAFTFYFYEIKIGTRQSIDGARDLCKSFWLKMWWLVPLALMAVLFKLFYDGDFPLKGETLEQKGQFGDSFGVLNSLFTGLGFGGLIVTLLMQQKQIAQQERQVLRQRYHDELRHYEETLHRLLALYFEALADASNKKGNLTGRALLRGSTDRVFEAIKKEKANLIPHDIRDRRSKKQMTEDDRKTLDYLYFRNFKILTVEIDRQGRVLNSLKVLLRHLLHEVPEYALVRPYTELICAQLTHVEISYFYLIALTFTEEDEFRNLFLNSGLMAKAANVYRMRIHDFMYEDFWGVTVGEYKKPLYLPIESHRINSAIKYRRSKGLSVESGHSSSRAHQDF